MSVFLCHFFTIFPFLSGECIWCISLHAFLFSGFTSQRQSWCSLGVLMHLYLKRRVKRAGEVEIALRARRGLVRSKQSKTMVFVC